MEVQNVHAAQMSTSFDTYIPVCRTWCTTVFAFVHLSSTFAFFQESSVDTILSMISCFLPDLEKCVLHSSLRPTRICFSLSTVLFLMLWRICLKHYSDMLQWLRREVKVEKLTSKSSHISELAIDSALEKGTQRCKDQVQPWWLLALLFASSLCSN